MLARPYVVEVTGLCARLPPPDAMPAMASAADEWASSTATAAAAAPSSLLVSCSRCRPTRGATSLSDEMVRHSRLDTQLLADRSADQLERHEELVAAAGAETHGGVHRREEDDGDGRRQELVVEDLDLAVQVGRVVEVRQVSGSCPWPSRRRAAPGPGWP